tara:strand:- start:941 stop:1297 length:357 start_codon:yes stop_codon:yes gene_type:complete
MANLYGKKEKDSTFESKGSIQEIIGLNKVFVIENASIFKSVNYMKNGIPQDGARLIVDMNGKKIQVHTMSQKVVSGIRHLIQDGLPSIDDMPNDNSSKVKLASYKNTNGTGYSLDWDC